VQPLITISAGKFATSVVRSNFTHGMEIAMSDRIVDIVGKPTIQYYTSSAEDRDESAFINIPHIHPGRDGYSSDDDKLRRVYHLVWQLTFLYGHVAIQELEKWTEKTPSFPTRLVICKQIVAQVGWGLEKTAAGRKWSSNFEAAMKDLNDSWFATLKKAITDRARSSDSASNDRERANLLMNDQLAASLFESGRSMPIYNPKTLLRLEDLNFGDIEANPNEP